MCEGNEEEAEAEKERVAVEAREHGSALPMGWFRAWLKAVGGRVRSERAEWKARAAGTELEAAACAHHGDKAIDDGVLCHGMQSTSRPTRSPDPEKGPWLSPTWSLVGVLPLAVQRRQAQHVAGSSACWWRRHEELDGWTTTTTSHRRDRARATIGFETTLDSTCKLTPSPPNYAIRTTNMHDPLCILAFSAHLTRSLW